jgi:hypothetical protein
MKLKEHIVLSQKHQKSFQVFRSFFTSALNALYFLRDEYGFRKPELSTWRNEANLVFSSEQFKVTVEYESPNWIEISFRRVDIPGKIYLEQLLEKLNIHHEKHLLGSLGSDDLMDIEQRMMVCLEKAGNILRDNWKDILEYIETTDTLASRPSA